MKKYTEQDMGKKLELDSYMFSAFENSILDMLSDENSKMAFHNFFMESVEAYLSTLKSIYEESNVYPEVMKRTLLYEKMTDEEITKKCRDTFNKYIEENVVDDLYQTNLKKNYKDLSLYAIQECKDIDPEVVSAYVMYEDGVKQFLFDLAFPRSSFKSIMEYEANSIVEDNVLYNLKQLSETINIIGSTISSILFENSMAQLSKSVEVEKLTGITNIIVEENVPYILAKNYNKHMIN